MSGGEFLGGRYIRLPRRWILKVLGVPFHIQDVFLDPRRWSVTVTSHAISQAGDRYRQGDPKFIALDVLDAMCHSRMGGHTPSNRHGAKAHSVLGWTADEQRVYGHKHRKRNIVVVTALPTEWSESEARARAERPIETKMAQAFAVALRTRGDQ